MVFHTKHYFDIQKRKQRLKFRIKFYAIAVAAISVCFAISYFLFENSFFTIQKFSIDGLVEISPDSIKSTLESEIRNKYPLRALIGVDNYFAWPEELAYNNSELKSLSIKKNLWRRSIHIVAQERIPVYLWCGSEECMWTDAEGVAFRDAPRTYRSLSFPMITDSRISKAVQGAPVLPQTAWHSLISAIDVFKGAPLELDQIVYEGDFEELSLLTIDGLRVTVSLRNGGEYIDSEYNALIALIKEVAVSKFSSIDLTVPGKIFTRRK